MDKFLEIIAENFLAICRFLANQVLLWLRILRNPLKEIPGEYPPADEEIKRAIIFSFFILPINYVIAIPVYKACRGISLLDKWMFVEFVIATFIGFLTLGVGLFVGGKVCLGQGRFGSCLLAGLYLAAFWPILTLTDWLIDPGKVPHPLLVFIYLAIYAFLVLRTSQVARAIHRVSKPLTVLVAVVSWTVVLVLLRWAVAPVMEKLANPNNL